MKKALWAFIAGLFLSVRWDSAIEIAGNRSRSQEKTLVDGQQTIREGIPWLYDRPAKDLFSHDALSWMDQVPQLSSQTRRPASGSPVVVMVQSSHDRNGNHLVACILSARNRSALFRDLLPNPLMRPCLVEVRDVRIEHALELLLLKDQQVVEAFLPDAPQEAFTDSIGSRCMIRCFENLDVTCPRHSRKARPKFGIVIPNQVLWRLSIGSRFPELLGYPGIGRRARDAHVDHLPRLEFDEEEGKERSKEQIGDL